MLKITDAIYKKYGSETDYLFGIEPKHKESIDMVIKITLDFVEKLCIDYTNGDISSIKEVIKKLKGKT